MSPRNGRHTPVEAAKAARIRVKKSMQERRRGLTDMDYLKLEELGDTVNQLVFRLQRNIENPIIHFRNIVGKLAYIASLMLKVRRFDCRRARRRLRRGCRFKTMVQLRHRLGLRCWSQATTLWLGSVHIDRNRLCDRAQNYYSNERARHQARSGNDEGRRG